MKRFFVILAAFFYSLFGFCVYAQQDTEFWFAPPFFNCSHGEEGAYRLIVFSFEKEVEVTISMPANPSFEPIVRTLSANSYANIVLATNKRQGDELITTPFNEIGNRGLLIRSTDKIECYYQVEGENSEAYTLKGKNALGTEFLLVGQKTYYNSTSFTTSGVSAHIVATQDNTQVKITPNNPIRTANNQASKEPVVVTLNKGQTYSVVSYSTQSDQNITGSMITSNRPIAVTTNDDSVTPGTGSADAIGEQILSTDFAGTKYVMVTQGRYYDVCTVFALENNTTITTSSGETYNLNVGQYQNINLYSKKALAVESDKPIMVFQVVSTGNGELGGSIVPHNECTGSSIAGYKSFSSNFDITFNIVTHKSNINSFTIDEEAIAASNFYAVDQSDEYYYAQISKSPRETPYIVKCSSGIFQMGVTEGDYSGSCTYGFFSDYAEQVPIQVKINDVQIDADFSLEEGVTLSMIAYSDNQVTVKNVEWHLPNGTIIQGDKVDLGTMNELLSGTYRVTGITSDCGIISRTFTLNESQKQHTVAQICEGETYTWNNKTYSEPNIYTETVKDQYGVNKTITLDLSVIAPPVLDLREDTAVEKGGKVQLWAKGADFVNWEPAELLTKDDEQRVFTTPERSTLFTATGANKVQSHNLIYNGGFEFGCVGFSTDFNFFTPYSSENIIFWGAYTITSETQGFRWESDARGYGGEGNMLLADGFTTPNATVWEQKVQVEPNTFYAFSAQVMSCYISNQENSYALLQFLVNGEQTGPIFHSPSTLYEWAQFYDVWYSGDATEATLTIKNQNSDAMGNDFGLDDIRFEPLSCSTTEDVLVIVWQHSNEEMTVCKNQLPFPWNTKTVTDKGEYIDTLISMTGFRDSIVTLNVAVNPSYDGIIDRQTIVQGQSYEWNGDVYTKPGYYNKNLYTIHGCDSAVTLRLDVTEKPTRPRKYDAEICEGEYYDFYGDKLTEANTYTKRLSYEQYDSLITLTLIVHPIENEPVYMTITEGQTYDWKGQTYSEQGEYPAYYKSKLTGCDSIVTLYLTVTEKEIRPHEFIAEICEGEYYDFYGDKLTETNTYTKTLSYEQYDSIITVNLVVYQHYERDTTITITEGESIQWGSEKVSQTGKYPLKLKSIHGCDSIVNLLLRVEPKTHVQKSEKVTICNGETYDFYGRQLTKSGTYTHEINAAKADTTITLQLIVEQPKRTDLDVILPDNGSYTYHGKTYTQEGNYEIHLKTKNGCDSLVVLHIQNPDSQLFANFSVEMETTCANDNLVLHLSYDNVPDSIRFTFSGRNKGQGFESLIIKQISPEIVVQHEALAGNYQVQAKLYKNGKVAKTIKTDFSLLYPSSVIEQGWNDALIVLAHNYNGGYDFKAFQWYKNGEIIDGENHSYIYQPLEMGAVYSAMLTEKDNTQLMTCGIIAVPHEDITLYPTRFRIGQKVICKVSGQSMMYVYDTTGKMVYSSPIAEGESEQTLPLYQGLYIVSIVLNDSQHSQQFKVQIVQ